MVRSEQSDSQFLPTKEATYRVTPCCYGRAQTQILVLMMSLLVLAACTDATSTYTLYRDSALDPNLRVHWATFDGKEGELEPHDFNQENCNHAADLLNKNVRVLNDGATPIRYWCEPGEFRN